MTRIRFTVNAPQIRIRALERISHSTGIAYRLTAATLKLLQDYRYPGNVRELRTILWAAVTLSNDQHIDVEHPLRNEPFHSPATHLLSTGSVTASAPQMPTCNVSAAQYHSQDNAEAGYLTQLLEECAVSRRRAAEQLGISERTLHRKLKRFHLNRALAAGFEDWAMTSTFNKRDRPLKIACKGTSIALSPERSSTYAHRCSGSSPRSAARVSAPASRQL